MWLLLFVLFIQFIVFCFFIVVLVDFNLYKVVGGWCVVFFVIFQFGVDCNYCMDVCYFMYKKYLIEYLEYFFY